MEQFRGDERFDEALLFDEIPNDEIGIAAYQDGEILGMAGATSDSPLMWQIGINVLPKARGMGVGSLLVGLLKNELLDGFILPKGIDVDNIKISSVNIDISALFW